MSQPLVEAIDRVRPAAPAVEKYPKSDRALVTIVAVVRARRWILAAAILAGVGAAAYRLWLPLEYESTATLAVIPPATDDGPSLVVPNVNTFRALIQNYGLATEVIDHFKLQEPPDNLTPREFLEEAMTVEEIRGTTLLRIRVRLQRPQTAPLVANDTAARAVALALAVTQQETIDTRDLLRQQAAEAESRLKESETALLAYQREAQIELLRRDVDIKLKQRERLQEVRLSLAAERAKATRVESELASRQPITTLTRSIDDDEVPVLEAARSSGASSDQLLRLQVKSERANPVFEDLDSLVANSRATVAGLEREHSDLLKNVSAAGMPTLLQLYERQIDLNRLETRYKLAQRVYDEVMLRLEQTRVKVASKSAQLQLVDKASVDRQMPRRVMSFALVGFVFGAFAAMCVVGLRFAVRDSTQHTH
jgi:uncharacterized protein involved in exopolysaccharide biosynthesis